MKFGPPSGLQPGHPQLLASPRGRRQQRGRLLTEAILRRQGLAVKGGRRGCGCGAAGATLDGRASIESRTELRGYVRAAGNQGDRSSFVLVKGFPMEGFQVFTVDGLEDSPRQSNSLPDSEDVRGLCVEMNRSAPTQSERAGEGPQC